MSGIYQPRHELFLRDYSCDFTKYACKMGNFCSESLLLCIADLIVTSEGLVFIEPLGIKQVDTLYNMWQVVQIVYFAKSQL